MFFFFLLLEVTPLLNLEFTPIPRDLAWPALRIKSGPRGLGVAPALVASVTNEAWK